MKGIATASWVATGLLLIAGAVRFHLVSRQLVANDGEPSSWASVGPPAWPANEELAAAASATARSALFGRLTQSSRTPGMPMRPPVVAGKLELRGVVGGPPWIAVIAGLPGVNGAASLRVGDSVAGYSVTNISRDSVKLRRASTRFTLGLTKP
jgi:hypothetical protein